MADQTVQIKIEVVGAESARSQIQGVSGSAKGLFGPMTAANLAATAITGTFRALVGVAGKVKNTIINVTESAISFEDAFAGVRKTVDASEDDFKILENNIKVMSSNFPIATEELAGIMEIAGQLGIEGVNDLTGFTSTMAKMGITTNMTAEDAAVAFAQIANVMETPTDQVENMASAVVGLGNNFATTESQIVDFAQRIAGTGKIVGLSEADVLGISTAFSSVGIEAEAGGTAVQKVLINLQKAVVDGGDSLQQFASVAGLSAKDFKKAFEEDAASAFEMFVSGLGTKGDEAFGILEKLGLDDARLTRSFLSVAQAGDLMSSAISQANSDYAANSALTEEANKRFATTASKLQILKNNFTLAAQSIGAKFLPILNKAISFVTTMVQDLPRFLMKGEYTGAFLRALGLQEDSPILWKILGFRDKVIEIFKSIKDKIRPSVNQLKDSIIDLGDSIGPAFNTILSAFNGSESAGEDMATGISSVFNGIINGVKYVIDSLTKIADWIAEHPQEIQQAIEIASKAFNIFGQIIGWVFENLVKYGPSLLNIIKYLIDFGTKIYNTGIQVYEFGASIVTFVNNAVAKFEEFKTAAITKITDTYNGIVAWFEMLPITVSEKIDSFKQTVTTKFNETKTSIINTVTSTINGIIGWFGSLPTKISDLMQNLVNKILWYKNGFKSAGQALIQGLIDGINSKVSELFNRATSMANSVASRVNSALGIHSPSKVFEDIGANVVEGFNQGIGAVNTMTPIDNIGNSRDVIRSSDSPSDQLVNKLLRVMGNTTNTNVNIGNIDMAGNRSPAQAEQSFTNLLLNTI